MPTQPAAEVGGQPVIEVDGVSRSFGGGRRSAGAVQALDRVSLQVRSGEVVGLLGPNGAGKTTLIRILSSTLTTDAGSARVAGFDTERDPVEVKRRIGVVFAGSTGLLLKLNGRDNLRFFDLLYGLPRSDRSERLEAALRSQGLADIADRKVGEYSHGMRQRLLLARAMLHDPPVLLLDEPTNGLDPVASKSLRDAIGRMRTEGKAILFCTHLLHEAEDVCDRLVILNRGRILAAGSLSQLSKRAHGIGVVEVRLPLDLEFESVAGQLRTLPQVTGSKETINERSRLLRLQTADVAALLLHTGVLSARHPIQVQTLDPTLEDVYLRLLGSSDGVD